MIRERLKDSKRGKKNIGEGSLKPDEGKRESFIRLWRVVKINKE